MSATGGVEGAPGLRERRRLATASEINRSALELFEARGVERTTVADIAQAAGISARTFFRYFATKELAALADLGWAGVVADWADGPTEPGEDVHRSFYAMLEGALSAFSGPDRRDHLLRVRRLAAAEPSIRLASLRAGVEHTEMVAAAVSRRWRGHCTEAEILALSRLGTATVEAAVDQWGLLTERGEQVDLVDVFRKICVAGQTLFAAGRDITADPSGRCDRTADSCLAFRTHMPNWH